MTYKFEKCVKIHIPFALRAVYIDENAPET